MNNYKKYIIFWLSQSISQLGSSMTSFALILWIYEQKQSAMSVSVISFCNYVPFIIVSLIAGSFVDKYSKKVILLIADSIAALCSMIVLILSVNENLQVWNIYLVNVVIGFMNAFQSPASAVAVGRIVPKDKLSNVSGMNSFSSNLITVFSPVLSAFVFSFGGLGIILLIDLSSFIFAFFILLLLIHIPEDYTKNHKKSILTGAKEGFGFIRKQKGLLFMIFTMALINFFSRLTYENILSPMILARSGGNNKILGYVNAAMGIGGIIGGIIISLKKGTNKNIRMIYFSAAFSFLFGDMLMAISRNGFMWSIAGIAASLPIPFIMAGQNLIMYNRIPQEMQGRVFAVRNTIQFCTIPVGILLGGFFADYIFEPFMKSGNFLANLLETIVGKGTGNGMAVMFLITGISGFLVSLFSYRKQEIRELDIDISG
ncbi:MAG: MFS transporter [Clostridiales bacterium]|nr:MFS transporter [Clostridiales bacterium]